MTSVPVDQPDWQNPQTGMAVYASIFNNTLILAGGQTATVDLSAYNSFIIWSATPITTGHSLIVIDPDSGVTIALLSTPPDALGNTLPPTMIPLRTQKVRIFNNAATGVTINVRATSRVVADISPLLPADAQDVFSASFGAAIGTETVGYLQGSGNAWFSWHWNTAAWRGYVQLLTFSGLILLADTSETHVTPQGGNVIEKLLVVPRDLCILQVVTVTAGAGNQTFSFVYGR